MRGQTSDVVVACRVVQQHAAAHGRVQCVDEIQIRAQEQDPTGQMRRVSDTRQSGRALAGEGAPCDHAEDTHG